MTDIIDSDTAKAGRRPGAVRVAEGRASAAGERRQARRAARGEAASAAAPAVAGVAAPKGGVAAADREAARLPERVEREERDETPAHGAEIVVPLNRLKASPNNARKVPHSAATIEGLAASIRVKGLLQKPVVEVVRDAEGRPTGDYGVVIGEGRRLALRLLAKRKIIPRTHPLAVRVDVDNDPFEISLDENVTREAMHPADQFEAFGKLTAEGGLTVEAVAARFGVSVAVVRQRLRLAAAAPELIAAYRAGALALDQLTAFCVSEDHDRQRQVLESIGPHTPVWSIRRAMTEAKVRADDRRARFVGAEAYEAAGGTILRDLFTEDGGGWFEDPLLLDRLVAEGLAAAAETLRTQEGWAWAEGALDFPYGRDFDRVYPEAVARTDAEVERIAQLSEAWDRIVGEADEAVGLTPDAEAELAALDAQLQAFGPEADYTGAARARAGAIITLGQDGRLRYERGLVVPEPKAEIPPPWSKDDGDGVGGGENTDEGPSLAPLSPPLPEALILDLTAHRTMGLRDAVQADPDLALTVAVHAMVLQMLYRGEGVWTPLQMTLAATSLHRVAPGVEDGPAGRRVADRLEAWGARLPERAADLWAVVAELGCRERLALLATCVGLGIDATHGARVGCPGAQGLADTLALASGLDMSQTWAPTAAAYLSRVRKSQVLEAVREGAGSAEADRIAGLKKTEMAEAAEALLAGTGWLPRLLRAPAPEVEAPGDETQGPAPERAAA